MNKQVALIILVSATLGLIAGQPRQESRQSGETHAIAPTVSVDPAIETPLVEKLLPKPVQPPNPTIADGQLSPRGEWRWSQAQVAWVPVAKAGPRWVENGHSATIDHLVRDHGYRRADLVRLTQYQLDTIHSNSHNSARARRVSAPTYCPSGRCPRR